MYVSGWKLTSNRNRAPIRNFRASFAPQIACLLGQKQENIMFEKYTRTNRHNITRNWMDHWIAFLNCLQSAKLPYEAGLDVWYRQQIQSTLTTGRKIRCRPLPDQRYNILQLPSVRAENNIFLKTILFTREDNHQGAKSKGLSCIKYDHQCSNWGGILTQTQEAWLWWHPVWSAHESQLQIQNQT